MQIKFIIQEIFMIKFGTGGWRAIIGNGFTKDNVQLITTALIHKLKDDKRLNNDFIIGYDHRFLSEEAAKWAAQVVAGENIHCWVINQACPTPLIMFAVNMYGSSGGIAITASHNPAVYNGIKIMEDGRDANEDFTRQIEDYVNKLTEKDICEMSYEKALASGLIELIDPMNDYIDSILSGVNVEAIRSKHLRVVLDPMYGVSKTALQTILITARCDVEFIHDRRDTLFGGRLPAPNIHTLSSLIKFVEEHDFDIGIATDGDADRLGVINDRAEFLHPNKILALLYYYLLKYKGIRGAAIRNVATTHLIDKIADSFGEVCYEVPVGFKYISSKMAEKNAVIGGESSGGLTVRGHIMGKDGIYAATLLIEMIAVTGRMLSELWREIEAQYGYHEMVERDYHLSSQKSKEVYKLLYIDKRTAVFPYEIDHINYMDGCKIYFKNSGWLITRFSGTEPLLRIFCEMDSEEKASVLIDLMEQFLIL